MLCLGFSLSVKGGTEPRVTKETETILRFCVERVEGLMKKTDQDDPDHKGKSLVKILFLTQTPTRRFKGHVC